ncbi:hypothetical protein LUZ62_066447 [Rhynchospora pubera]|uniref:Histidine-containing phosphotransfer protein n=1 Tax=Rhynchospora pubera TaxID=906938 RepID=A0AAV8ERN4_9POAL|nr:hypothetical protein LUZ62_066447 [Rhynchospora pubera]
MAPRTPTLAELLERHNYILQTTLLHEGLLNYSSYQVLKEGGPNNLSLAHESVTDFFKIAGEAIDEMRKILSKKSGVIDQNNMAIQLHLIKGSSDYIGTTKVSSACKAVRDAYTANDKERCRTCIKELKSELGYVKPRMEALMECEKNIMVAAGRII